MRLGIGGLRVELLTNNLDFLDYLDDMMKDSYKSERFVRFIKEFHEAWRAEKINNFDDGCFKIWGTVLIQDENMEIKNLLWDPIYSKINDFFETKNKMYLKEITEEDLVDLALYEGIGKVKYFMFMKLLFGDSNVKFDYKINSNNINNVNNIDINVEDNSETKPINIIDEVLDKSITSIYDSLETIKTHFESKVEEYYQQFNLEKEKNNNLELKLKNKEAQLVNLKLGFDSEKENNKEQIRDLLIDISDTYERKKEVEKELDQATEKINYLDNEIKNRINEIKNRDEIIKNIEQEVIVKNNEIKELKDREIEHVDEINRMKNIYENEISLLKNEIESHKKTIAEFSSLRGMVEHILDKFRKNTQSND